ncbi:MAG: hypothetical protein JWM80_6243 [Cyanobacteria bacterium RYN_339]|nr:hypothetical protein [Cyanobacteria bacterium RYN_339]
MPIYEYRCEPCGHRFEAYLASSAEQASCPLCAGTQLNRLMSTFASSAVAGYKSVQPAGPAPGAVSKKGCGGGCACH